MPDPHMPNGNGKGRDANSSEDDLHSAFSQLLQQILFPGVPLGQIVVTANALVHLSHEDILTGLRRHRSRDWGELDAFDWEANDRALLEGTRLLSAYTAANGEKFWIITEADRSATTILLPEDY